MNAKMLYLSILRLIFLCEVWGGVVHESESRGEVERPVHKDVHVEDSVTIKKGGEDKYEYKHFMLGNGAKVVLIRRDDLEKSAACVSVNVGSNEDPKDSEGLAHFLEHMLFMGSEKYPEESGYQKYITGKGGICGAHTRYNKTVFYYDVLPEAFEESLDVFSGFFTSPLIRKDSIEREVKAVDSEYSLSISYEPLRFWHLTTVLRKEESEMGKFAMGSKNTLFGDDLRERVYEFWKRKYSAEKFCIVLGGKQSFDVLEGYARKYFSDIPVREKEIQEDNGIGYFHYDEKYTGKLIKMKPAVVLPDTKSFDLFTITITVPETISIYKKKVDSYIRFLLETTKEGGFMNVMKSNEYFTNMSVSLNPRKVNTEICIAMELLPKGKKRISEIKSLLKEYLRIIRESTCKEVFDILRRMNENQLKNLEGGLILCHSIMVAANAQYFPMEDVVINSMVFEDYDDKYVKEMLDIMLDDSKWIHIYLTTEGIFDNTEKHYGLEYGISEYDEFDSNDKEYKDVAGSMRWPFGTICSDEIKCPGDDGNVIPLPEEVIGKILVLDNIKKYSFCELRKGAKDYMKEKGCDGKMIVGSSKMEMIPLDDVSPSMFSCGLKDGYGEMRYVGNKEFEMKEIALCIKVTTDEYLDDIEKTTRCYVHFTGFYTEFINKYKHDINVLNISLNIFNDGRTLTLRANGPAPGVYALAEIFFKEYKYSSVKCTESSVDSAKCRVENMLTFSINNTPLYGTIAPEVTRRLSGVGFREKELLSCVKKIKSTDELVKIRKGHICFMVSGNGTFEEAVELYRRIRMYVRREKKTRRRIYPVDENGKYIPGGESRNIDSVVYVETNDSKNNAVGVFQDLGPAVDKEISSMAILVSMMLESKFFEQLRTKECMGYVVSMAVRCLDNALTMFYVVQSETKAEDIHERISRFIKESYEIAEEMSPEQFADYVNSAADSVLETPKDLMSFLLDVSFEWTEAEFNLRRKEEISEAIRRIKKTDVLSFLKKEHKRIIAYAIHGDKKQ